MKTRSLLLLLGSTCTIAACDGLKEALTAHTDVAAKAESQELSVTRLGDLMGNSSLQITVNRDVAMLIADLWMNYQLLGLSAARGDSLNDPKLIDEATLGVTSNIRLRRFMEGVASTFKAESASEATYNQASGGLLVARHILFQVPGGATQQQKDSVRRVAEGVRARTTTANFADLARRYGSDGTREQGGNLGAFRPGDMVKPFYDAVAALRPGEISMVETNFGYHIIQRPTYAAAKQEFDAAFGQGSMRLAESTYVAKLDQEAGIEVKSNAATLAKAAARDLSGHREEDDVMATYKGGELDVARFVTWVESYPPQMRLPQQMAQAPDSLVNHFVKSIARNEVMLQKADSAGIKLTAEETSQLHNEFKGLLASLQQQIGIDAASLADSARSVPERERLAATRVEAFLERMMAGQAQPVSVPPPIQAVLSSKYDAKTYPAGVDRAVERASRLRSSADSARAASQPRSQVPLPTPPADSARRDTGATKRP
ncbi:MAG TPA: peptidylprolyl isomerase [Gemmatimonadaceae bacterium]|nr:peptidylprolyl isomerase [Gemmatimonadaceae bacterium]